MGTSYTMQCNTCPHTVNVSSGFGFSMIEYHTMVCTECGYVAVDSVPIEGRSDNALGGPAVAEYPSRDGCPRHPGTKLVAIEQVDGTIPCSECGTGRVGDEYGIYMFDQWD
jgi:DNA-directed RNA polymerase subunit RPC12/RpoP